ncbi:MAG: indole-3-glycerol phosphate synthase TrpC [Solirubrobacterales bacterium]
MGMIEELVRSARKSIERHKAVVSLAQLEEQIGGRQDDRRPFNEALTRPGLSLIAEFKRRSPSASLISSGASVTEVVRAYEEGGAAAISVLTDEENFGGSLDDLREARLASDLPILRKDFIVEPYQLYEAAANGADAVLLIVAALEVEELDHLHQEARAIDLDVLVEVHDSSQLEVALEIDADVLGINNRNLETFEIDVQTTFDLMPDVPAGKTVVSESGFSHRVQLEELSEVGVDAVLIGEALMRSGDPESAIGELLAGEEPTSEHQL